MAANGKRFPNQGQVDVHNVMKLSETPITSTFQESQIWRPLWSLGKDLVCDVRCTVTFTRDGAQIHHLASGKKVGDFTRKQGLYVGDFKLRNPAKVFNRQGQ